MEQPIIPQILFVIDLVVFGLVVLMHISKKSISFVSLYAIQSFIVAALLIYSSIHTHSISLILLALLIFAVKVIMAPKFFVKMIKKQTLQTTTNNYLNPPATISIIAIIAVITHSKSFAPLATLAPANESALLISVAAMFASLFLIINRKGALSQMIGVLSLENCIVAFAFAAGLEQGPGLELGITFDIFAWIMIATVFVSMIYKKFKTLDVSVMTNLKG